MELFTTLWIGWLVFFVGVEAAGLLSDREDRTLSEHVWRWFAVNDDRPDTWSWVRRLTLGGFLAWLSVHFLTGGWV